MNWDPGPRPPWVLHALGGEGGPSYSQAARPLVAEELLSHAELVTGLDSWGPPDFRPALETFIRSVERESQLHLVGRARVRHDLLHALENRLRMYTHVGSNPAVQDEVITAPIVVTGSPRAGTSIIHELLAMLPGTRAPLTWEYWWPTPPPQPTGEINPRMQLADADARMSAGLAPQFDGMHTQGASVPREDGSAMMPTLRSDVLWTHYGVPTYEDWVRRDGLRPAYQYHQLVLRVLQHGTVPKTTWVCKAPSHLGHLELLLEHFPDARIVVCHRDPLAMISSVTSLTATLRWAHSDHVDYEALGRANLEQFGRNLDAVLELRKRGVLTDDRCIDVRFDEFVGDQVGTAARIARRFDVRFDEKAASAMSAHLAARPRGHHGGHSHSMEALGLEIENERKRFAEYMDFFSIRPERLEI